MTRNPNFNQEVLCMLSMQDINLHHKRVLIREDLNVPIHDGVITNFERIDRALPTIQQARAESAAVLICSHLGRPTEGEYDEQYSLQLVASALSERLGQPVRLVKDWLDGVEAQPGEVVLCENVRFNPGEKANDEALARQMAACCDVFVMDAFATAHRAHASTVGVIQYAPMACAGPLLLAELKALTQALDEPTHPVVAIVGGAKVSSKLLLLERLMDRVDTLIVGGGIANTFLKAGGFEIGQSLYEVDFIPQAQAIMRMAEKKGVSLPLPVDVAVADRFDGQAQRRECAVDAVAFDDLILDVGANTASTYADIMASASTILWNGPVGVFEFPGFAAGTKALAKAVADSNAYSLAGGGDTVSAINQFGIEDNISYISTGGGAFLEWVQGDILPAVKALEKRKTV